MDRVICYAVSAFKPTQPLFFPSPHERCEIYTLVNRRVVLLRGDGKSFGSNLFY